MTLFNGIGEGGLNQLLGKRLNIPGAAASPTVEPAIFPALVLENDRPEYGFLKGENRFAGSGAVAAGGAGTRSSVQLINTRRAQIVVVERARITMPAGATLGFKLVFLGLDIVPVGTAQATVGVDTRLAPGTVARASSVVLTDNTLAVAGGAFFDLAFNAAAFVGELDGAVVLSPGWALYASATADNVAITSFSFRFRERQANPLELG